MTKSPAIPAVLYLRMSSTSQELSLEQQTIELRQLAERENYAITDVYQDAGKSGSKDTAKRPEFLRLINDAQKGNFTAILVWDTSRFGRLNSIDVGQYVSLLMKSNVFLHSVKEGKFDWREDVGRIMWTLFCEANHRFSISLSNNVLRGRKNIAGKSGLWASGKIPFGFDRQYVGLDGTPKQLVKRSTKFKKPGDWHLTLAINPDEAEIVRIMFNRFATEDISLRELANQLNKSGYSCGGEMWTSRLLKLTLTNPAYVGRSYYGARSHKSMTAHNRAGDTHGKENQCPALVELDTWNSVASILQARTDNRSKPKTVSAGLLSGFLFCQCGRSMEKRISHNKVTYICARANKNKGGGCEFWSVDETDVAEFVFSYLETNVSEELVKLAEARKTKKPENFGEVLKSRRDKLKKELENGRQNALFAPPELSQQLFTLLQEKVIELKEVENALALAADEPVEGWAKWWEQHRAEIMLLCQRNGFRVVGGEFAIPSQGSPIATDKTRLKGLFRHIGLRLQLTFGLAPIGQPKARGRQRKWMVIRRELSVKIGEGKSDNGANEICVGMETHTIHAINILTILILL